METLDFDYYQLSLLKYLKEHQPQMADDNNFIKNRADIAAQAYEDSRKQGYDVVCAKEIAMKELYRGLDFSLYDTILDTLDDNGHYDKDIAFNVLKQCLIPGTAFFNLCKKYLIDEEDFEDTAKYDDFKKDLFILIKKKKIV